MSILQKYAALAEERPAVAHVLVMQSYISKELLFYSHNTQRSERPLTWSQKLTLMGVFTQFWSKIRNLHQKLHQGHARGSFQSSLARWHGTAKETGDGEGWAMEPNFALLPFCSTPTLTTCASWMQYASHFGLSIHSIRFDFIWFDSIWFHLVDLAPVGCSARLTSDFQFIRFDLIWFVLNWFDLIWFDFTREETVPSLRSRTH